MIKIGQSMHPEWVGGDLGRLDEELRQVKDAGADCCELVLHGLDVVIGNSVIPSRQDAVIEVLRKHELDYTMHMPHGLNLLDAEMLETWLGIFRAGIKFAQTAGIKLINYHAGIAKSDDKSLIKKEMEQIKTLATSAPNIVFCMENLFFYGKEDISPARSAGEMIAFYEQINLDNFKLTFDIGHSFLRHKGNKGAMLKDMDALLPYIGHVHLHDNFGTMMEPKGPGPGPGFGGHRIICGIGDIHLPLGWGSIPIDDALAKLENYNGIVNLEIEHRFNYNYKESLSLVREKLKTVNG